MYLKQILRDLLSLSKVIISLSVTYTAFVGFLVSGSVVNYPIFIVLAGLFLLSSGASAFNQIIERHTDALMKRTQNRPVPTGRIGLKTALVFAISLSVTGTAILYVVSGWLVAVLGIFNLLWYNLVYTPLKRVSIWALFTGTITGVIPFYMGYFSNTVELPSLKANFIAIFLLIWQIPHFLLLLGIYGKEYEKAGLAAVSSSVDPSMFSKMAILWLTACAIIPLFFPLFHLVRYKVSGYLIISICFIVILGGLINFFYKGFYKPNSLFIISNLLQISILSVLVFDCL